MNEWLRLHVKSTTGVESTTVQLDGRMMNVFHPNIALYMCVHYHFLWILII